MLAHITGDKEPLAEALHIYESDYNDDSEFGLALVGEVTDFIEKRIREHHDDEAKEKLICMGCLSTLLGNVLAEILERSEADNDLAARWHSSIGQMLSRRAEKISGKSTIEGLLLRLLSDVDDDEG